MKIISDLIATLETSKQWSDAVKILNKNDFQPSILCQPNYQTSVEKE